MIKQRFSSGVNLALHKETEQISTYNGIYGWLRAKNAVDGNTNTDYMVGMSCSRTKVEEAPWWIVNLGDVYTIKAVTVLLSSSGSHGFYIGISMTGNSDDFMFDASDIPTGYNICGFYAGSVPPQEKVNITCDPAAAGQYVVVQIEPGPPSELILCEVEVFGTPEVPKEPVLFNWWSGNQRPAVHHLEMMTDDDPYSCAHLHKPDLEGQRVMLLASMTSFSLLHINISGHHLLMHDLQNPGTCGNNMAALLIAQEQGQGYLGQGHCQPLCHGGCTHVCHVMDMIVGIYHTTWMLSCNCGGQVCDGLALALSLDSMSQPPLSICHITYKVQSKSQENLTTPEPDEL